MAAAPLHRHISMSEYAGGKSTALENAEKMKMRKRKNGKSKQWMTRETSTDETSRAKTTAPSFLENECFGHSGSIFVPLPLLIIKPPYKKKRVGDSGMIP